METEVKAWRIAVSFDGVFELNLNLMERKHLFFKTEAYQEHTKILSQACDAVAVPLCLCPSVPQRARDYLHGHSVLDVPVKHIHMQRQQVRDLMGFANFLHCLSALGQNLFCLFLRILAEYLSSMGNFICFMRRRSRSS